MTPRQVRVLGCCGLALLLASLDGAVLLLTLPAIARDFHAEVPSLANLGSVVALGAVGALPLGVLADRRGRRTLLIAGTFGFGVADLLSFAAPSLPLLAAARLAAVVFEVTVGEVALVLAVEEMPAAHRGLGAAAMTFAGGAGAGITTVAYPFIAPHWRLLYLGGALALPAAILIRAALPESGAWEGAHLLPPVRWKGAWVRRLAIVAISAALSSVLYEPAGVFMTLYASRQLGLGPRLISLVVIAAGVAAAVCYPLGGLLTDRVGRRLPGIGLAFGNVVGAGLAFAGGLPYYWAGNVLFGALNSAAGPVFGAWLVELFPTRARVTAEMIDTVAGAVGGVIGLQVAAALAGRFGLGRAVLAEVLFGVAGALVLLLLPETRGRPLEN